MTLHHRSPKSAPLAVEPGTEVFAVFRMAMALLEIRVAKMEADSANTPAILNLIESAAQRKIPHRKAHHPPGQSYTPAVVASALLLFLIPTLLGFAAEVWLKRALIFLIVSCPCALIKSIPLSYYIGIGLAAQKGH